MRRIDASGSGERISALEGMSVAEKALTEEKARGPRKERGLEGFWSSPPKPRTRR